MSRNGVARIFLVICLFTLSFSGVLPAMAANTQCSFTLYNEVHDSDKTPIAALPQVLNVGSSANVYSNPTQTVPLLCSSNPARGTLLCNPPTGSSSTPVLVLNTGSGSTNLTSNPSFIHNVNKSCYTPATTTAITKASAKPGAAANLFGTASVIVPTFTSISPNVGWVVGGTSVTITGTGFTNPTRVTFGGVIGTITSLTPTSLTVTVPGAASTGTVSVRVGTLTGKTDESSAAQFTYVSVPTIYSLSANSGPMSGGTSVSITGSGFTQDSQVFFGSQAAASVTVQGTNSIIAISPAGSGPVGVRVVTLDGASVANTASRFTYARVPTVTAISPSVGPTRGGTTVTINGTNLLGATDVFFGTTSARSFTINSATSITATSPAGSGAPDVRVVTGGGVSATSGADKFTYYPVPTVTGISTTTGPVTGGNSLTITGTGFTGATNVDFGRTPASITAVTDTAVTVTVPSGLVGTVTVTVTTPGGTSSASVAAKKFKYVPVPSVSGISINSGPVAGGNSVTISGADFSDATTVSFGSVPATITSVTNTTLVAIVPAGSAGTVAVTLRLSGSSSAISAGNYTYTPVPTVASLSVNSGPAAGGNSVTITGTGFISGQSVYFGNTLASITSATATTITAKAPAGPTGTVDVTVTTPGGTSPTSFADRFTYIPAPIVNSLSVNSGPLGGGASVTINGTNLTGATGVTFGGHAATITSVIDTTIIATVPAGVAGTVGVIVTTPGGTSSTGSSARYTYLPVPTVTHLSFTSGSVAGGTSLTISGTSFADPVTVRFGGTPATNVRVVSSQAITATAPAGFTGMVDVIVTTSGGTSVANSADKFTYVPIPVVTSLSVNSGSVAGGGSMTITGTNFTGATRVSFGHTNAPITLVTAASILVNIPAGSAGTVDVTVMTPGGTSATVSGDRFTYR